MFVLAAGLLARAAVGPVERLLNMLGEQRVCAMVYAGAFAINLALCIVLIPRFGAMGAAVATATALDDRVHPAVRRDQKPARLPRLHLGPRGALAPCTASSISPRFRVEWRPLAELAALASEWRALASRALEPNVFYEPAFALAAQEVFGRGVGAGLVWSHRRAAAGRAVSGADRAPALRHPAAGAGRLDPSLCSARRAAGRSRAGPSRDRDLVRSPHPRIRSCRSWRCCRCPLDGPLASALDAAVAGGRGRSASFGRHARALLAPDGAREDYLDRARGREEAQGAAPAAQPPGGRRRRMSSSVAEPSASACARRLPGARSERLEGPRRNRRPAQTTSASSWRAAVAGLAGEGKARVDRLLVDARPIAAAVTLRSGATAWNWKIAYDEAFARFSPGVQLMLDVTEGLLGDPAIARVDSCATPDHPMIDHLWRERLVLADRLIRIGPDGSAGFAVRGCARAALRAAIAGAKAARGLLRR